MGFETFPAQSPSTRIAATVGPLCFSRTRTSHPPKLFPPQQPFCVTTFVSFSPLHAQSVSSLQVRGLKALLCWEVRCHLLVLLPTDDSMLPWALFPFKVLPSCSNALLKTSGVPPPKRINSGYTRRSACDLDFTSTEVAAEQERSCSSQRSCSYAASRDMVGTEAPSHAGLPTKCQPALEFFERPLLRFLSLICRLRRSPASRVHALQRSFRDEVALISRVFSFPDRSPLTSC